MNLEFSHPLVLITIPLIVSLWYVFGRERIGTIHPNALVEKYLKTPKSIWILWTIRLSMVSILVSIVASLNLILSVTRIIPIPQDIMIVFDISLSMLAEDVVPNRITVAKNVIRNFISTRTGDRIGLIIFSGKPFVSIPFSTDYRGISSIVSGLSPYLIRQEIAGLSGTNIGDALLLANMTYSGTNNKARSIILITDGRANIGIDPLVSAAESSENGISIFPIGVGSSSGSDLYYTDSYGQRTYFYDTSGQRLQSDLDEPMMRRLADTTGGVYSYATDRAGLDAAFSRITAKIPNQSEQRTEIQHIDLTPVLILIFLVLLLIERVWLRHIMHRYRLI